jgi:hypothetical protein
MNNHRILKISEEYRPTKKGITLIQKPEIQNEISNNFYKN